MTSTQYIIILIINMIPLVNKGQIPPAPENLAVKVKVDNNKTTAYLTWDKNKGDETIGYQIFSSFPPDSTLYWHSQIPMQSDTIYSYALNNDYAAYYHFAVCAVNKNNHKSTLSNIVKVLSPSKLMPTVVIEKIERLDNGNTQIRWQCEDVIDLAGFKIYGDGELIGEVGRKVREFTIKKSFQKIKLIPYRNNEIHYHN